MQVSHWGLSNIRHHSTKFSRLGDLVPVVCVPLICISFFHLMTSELSMPLNLIMIVACYSVIWILFECGALQISWNSALVEQVIAFSKEDQHFGL